MSSELVAEVGRLEHLLRGRGPGWYVAHAGDDRSRAEVLRALVATLARLGAEAGSGQPPRATAPVLGDHALADQLRLLAHEIVIAPGGARVNDAALAQVRTARAAL